MISELISIQKIRLEDENYLIFFIVDLGKKVNPAENCEVTSYQIDNKGIVEPLLVSKTATIE